MGADDREEEQLRAVALENARSIMRARQRAERDLVAAKEALEQQTQALSRSLAMIRATLESTFDGILVSDVAGRVTGCNEKFLRMWQLPPQVPGADQPRLLELCARQFLQPSEYLARVAEICAGPAAESHDLLELADGRVFERFSIIEYLDGQNVGRVWSFRDVTTQKQTEAQLREQREWFRVTLASIGDGVITTDVHGCVSFMNPMAERMTGWQLATARAQPLERVFTIVNEFTREPVVNPVQQVLREGTIVALSNHTLLLARDGSEIPIEDSAAPIRDAHDSICGTVMVFHDVSGRRRAEAALRDADRRKDEFLATLAHELRNPLAPIRQAALISKAPGATEAQKRWSHDVIDRQVQQMSLLLDDLLDISRVTRGTLVLRIQPSDLAAVIDAAVETARRTIDAKRHTLSVEVPEQPVRFNADPLRIAQMLSNLLTNAAKYTDPEGHIRLTARCAADEVIIQVADSGIGISADSLPTIFEMFAQVAASRERSEGGLGIGLALTKGLAELHGGRIEARSPGLGRGSEFTLHLPLKATARAPQRAAAPGDAPRPPVRQRILIADDNRDSAETLCALLRLDGHEVRVVHDGPEALTAFGEFRPAVVLLDIGMPGLDGYEVAQRMCGACSWELKLVAITGWAQENDRERALAAGFDHHLTKPVDLQRLRALLQPEGAAAAPASY